MANSEFSDLKKAFEFIFSRPIAFHAALGHLAGGAAAGLMLSQACYWSSRTQDEEGWFFKTWKEWQEETTLSRREQQTARKSLKAKGYLKEELRGVPAKLWYQVNWERIWQDLGQPTLWEGTARWALAPNKMGDSRKLDGRNLQTFKSSESTSESTSERKAYAQPDGFAQFWSLYPRPIAKLKAMRAWQKLPRADQAIALAFLNTFHRWPEQQFIPYPASWLNARRWEDETPLSQKSEEMQRGSNVGRNYEQEHLEQWRIEHPAPILPQVRELARKKALL